MDSNIIQAYTGNKYNINTTSIDEEEINAIKHGITINTNFAYWIFEKFKDNDQYGFCQLCVARFICCSSVKKELVEKYKPVFFINNIRLPYSMIRGIIEQYEWLRYSIALCCTPWDFLEKFLKEPEYNIIWYCAKSDKEVYERQVNKAKELGFVYKYFDIEKGIYHEPPLRIDLTEIPEFKQDLDAFTPFQSERIEEVIASYLRENY